MGTLPTKLLGVLWLAMLVAGCDCGDDDTEGDGDADADSDGDGDGDTDADGDADGDGDGDGDADDCGGSPCANHEGEQEFVAEDAPPGAADLFEAGVVSPAGTDPEREPAILYPSHETMFPVNVSHIRHEWRDGGNTLFALVFEGPRTTVRVFTAGTDWEPTDEAWDWIAESNRGEAVTFTVLALDEAEPAAIWQSAPITLYYSRLAVEGAIYYWSTGSRGVMKGLVSNPVPLKFYTDPAAEDAETCTACHTLSRDGRRLAVGYAGERLREVSVPEREIILPVGDESPREMSWSTFSPDGSMLIVARDGELTLIDSDSGAPIGDDDGLIPIPEGLVATHPDWSALGDSVAVTLGTNGGNKDTSGGSIAILPYAEGVWGEARVIVQSADDHDNNFFPKFSPDSQWIAYAHATEGSKDAESATLRLVGVEGGEPILLTRLNERVNDEDGVTRIGSTMPTWAPSSRAGVFFLAFSSLRAYATLSEGGIDQIWIAAIDPAAADPGYAAFWAPFQSIPEGNHRAFWTNSTEDTPCYCAEFCGDRLDNDCDGTADEDDCVDCAAAEICGDGIDNDCDCAVDDCVEEICDDGIDNDNDGLTDLADDDCLI